MEPGGHPLWSVLFLILYHFIEHNYSYITWFHPLETQFRCFHMLLLFEHKGWKHLLQILFKRMVLWTIALSFLIPFCICPMVRPCCALRCLLISMSSCYGSYCFYSLNWWVAWDVIIWIILILNKILSSPNHNFQFIWFYLLLFSITYWRREIMLCLILISLTQKI